MEPVYYSHNADRIIHTLQEAATLYLDGILNKADYKKAKAYFDFTAQLNNKPEDLESAWDNPCAEAAHYKETPVTW